MKSSKSRYNWVDENLKFLQFGTELTSKSSAILPTLVAPTAVIVKNPYFQRPANRTRSLMQNKLATRRVTRSLTPSK